LKHFGSHQDNMADDTIDEIIPWHFFNAKTLEDAEELSKIKDQKDLERRLSARKGWLTKALERVKADRDWNFQFKLTGKEPYARFNETKTFLEVRMAMLVNTYRRLFQVITGGPTNLRLI